jgi:tetratricopeptide (TPR) repeat protein
LTCLSANTYYRAKSAGPVVTLVWHSIDETTDAAVAIRCSLILREKVAFMRTKLVIAALLLVLLGAGSFWYFRGGTKLTEADTILLGDFANAAGDPVFDGSLRDALSISLAQSPLLNLISAEKVTEALRAQSLPTSAPITREFAPKICQRLGATVFLTGSIARNSSGYDLKLSAFRCSDSGELASVKTETSAMDGVVHALGSAASELRGELGEDSSSVKKFDVPLDRATTPSLEALKSFAEGRRLTREQGSMEAVAALKKAVELDPRFALAYSNLAVGYYNLNQNALAADRIRQAFELADRQTVRDHLHITTLYYDLGTGDVQKAIASYKEWVKLYPRDDIAKGNLASEYFLIGDYEQAADFAQQALRLDPGSTAWYENVSTAYIALMRLEEAQSVLNQAFSRKLDDPAMHADLYALAFLQGDSVGMQREMTWSVGKAGGEDAILALQADTEAYAGHVQKARELSRRAVEVAQASQLSEPAAIWQGIAALREAVYGNAQEARTEADKVLQIAPNSRDAQTLVILVLTRTGDLRRSQSMLDDLAAANVSNTVVQSAWLPTIRAQMSLINQRPSQALDLLETVKPFERGQLIGNLSYSCMVPVYLRAEAYLAAKQGPQALAEFQKLADSRGIVGNCWSGALALLGQARAQTLAGSTNAARNSYRRFFDSWKSADADVPILKSARSEFAKLK